MKTALFAGSFAPFTIGHQNIAERALPLFDRLIIGIGFNTAKKNVFSAEESRENISQLFKNEPKIEVKIYSGLTMDFAKENDVNFFVRSVRTFSDFEYEQNLAEINRKIGGIETVIFFAQPNLAHISSSMVRELISYGKDVSDFLPKKNGC
jgi:pantetheine-phosphate adenylyltransferase